MGGTAKRVFELGGGFSKVGCALHTIIAQNRRNRMNVEKNKKSIHLTKTTAMRRTGGFTLIELMVVLLIIGLLAGLIGLKVLDRIDEAKVTNAEAEIYTLHEGVKLYYRDTNKLPQDLLDLLEEPPDVEGWKGYIENQKQLEDPWGNEYQYFIEDEGARKWDIYSLGADGEESGDGIDADIHPLQDEKEDLGV
jgi:general secretion pathway protein G